MANLRPLVIGAEEVKKLKALVENAEANPLSMDDLFDTMNGQKSKVGNDPAFTCDLPVGYRVVLSMENQEVGKVRHLSMSVDEKDKLPNEAAVLMVMIAVGFENPIEDCVVFIENCGGLGRDAINVVEVVGAKQNVIKL